MCFKWIYSWCLNDMQRDTTLELYCVKTLTMTKDLGDVSNTWRL